MKDTLFLIISIVAGVFLIFDYIKYTNKNVFYQKCARLDELQELIHNLENDINSDDRFITMLAKNKGDELVNLRREYRKIKSYLL